MKRLSLRRKHAFDGFDQAAPKLRVVTEPAQIISWPYAPQDPSEQAVPEQPEPAQPTVKVTADVRTKRFAGHKVDEERYAATIDSADTSPLSVLTALVDAFGSIDEFKIPGEPGRPVILEVRIRA